MLLDEDGTGEAEQYGRVAGETDDIGAACDLLIEVFESLNYQLKNAVENRGDFRNGDAAIKLRQSLGRLI